MRQPLSSFPVSNFRYWPATATPRGSLHPFGSGQRLNPYASHYRMPFAFSAFSYPLHQQLSLRIACHLAMFREVGGESGLPRSRSCRPECDICFISHRDCPFSARLFPGSVATTYSQTEQEQPAAYHLVWACQPLWPNSPHEVYRRFTSVAHAELAWPPRRLAACSVVTHRRRR